MVLPQEVQAAAKSGESGWRWDKSVCRFCGTGCGVMVATKDDKIIDRDMPGQRPRVAIRRQVGNDALQRDHGRCLDHCLYHLYLH